MDKNLYMALAYVVVINLITFLMFYIDKQEHRRHRHPHGISTHLFMTLAILGGSLGELLGMLCFHHKHHHKEFLILLPIFLFIHIVVAMVVLRMYFSTDVDIHDLVPA